MQLNSTKKIFLSILTFFVLLIFARFFTLLSFPDSHVALQKGALAKLEPKSSLTQEFTANHAGLAKIEVLLRTPGIKSENGDRVEAKLMGENCDQTLRAGELEKAFLASENLYEFAFARLPDSLDKNFCLKLTFLPQKDSAKNIQVFTMSEAENQPLSVRPVYVNQYFWQDFAELGQRMSQYKPWFLKDIFLFLLIFGCLFVSIFILLLFIL